VSLSPSRLSLSIGAGTRRHEGMSTSGLDNTNEITYHIKKSNENKLSLLFFVLNVSTLLFLLMLRNESNIQKYLAFVLTESC